MKKFVIGLMIIQVILFIGGVYNLIEGRLVSGLIGVIVNPIFFMVNVNTLKSFKS